jgi:hypothetical protein
MLSGPGWLTAGFAAVMLVVAAYCSGRLAIWWLRGRHGEVDADGVHVLMGVAMAGMLEPRLSAVPDAAWLGMFAAAATWFAVQAILARVRRAPGGLVSAHPAPHAAESAVMLYMLLAARPADHDHGAAMAGMSGARGAASNPALAVVLALFMLGYILWTTDQLAASWRAATGPRRTLAAERSRSRATGLAASGRGFRQAQNPNEPGRAGQPCLAPGLAACYKIAMGAGMSYMLLTML